MLSTEHTYRYLSGTLEQLPLTDLRVLGFGT
jgi:hypothetical protein